jgi:hypothetical protein
MGNMGFWRRVWRKMTCSPEPVYEEFDGVQVYEGKRRTYVVASTKAPMPYALPLIIPSDVDAETMAFLRSH